MRTLIFLAVLAAAQAQQTTRVEFEVVSVKPGNPLNPGSGMSSSLGGIRFDNVTLYNLILNAYRLNQFQLAGGPKWLATERFNIEARFPAESRKQLPEMLQTLLADRFKLVAHRESRTLPVFYLTVAKGGAKLEKTNPEQEGHTSSSSGPRLLKATAAPLSMFANMLIGAAGAPVEDKTGIEGAYNFNLQFAPMQGATPEDDARPSLFSALQQIGLKLEPAKGPVEMLVIDSAQLPDWN